MQNAHIYICSSQESFLSFAQFHNCFQLLQHCSAATFASYSFYQPGQIPTASLCVFQKSCNDKELGFLQPTDNSSHSIILSSLSYAHHFRFLIFTGEVIMKEVITWIHFFWIVLWPSSVQFSTDPFASC